MDPRWTILLPAHDRAEVIGYAIRSVLAQTVEEWELLVVGDGCTDATGSVVTSFGDDRIRWFDLPKAPGFGYANRNIALREARGTLVAFLDPGDLLLPDHLERMRSPFEAAEVEWAYSRPLWVADDGTCVPFAVDLRRPADLHDFIYKVNRIPSTCVAFRRACLDRYGYWSLERMKGGDWELWTRIVGPARGANLDHVSTPTALHFRAPWKPGPDWGPAPLSTWLQVARDSWWPRALELDVPDDVLPQAHAWDALEAGGGPWLERFRDGVVSAIDGFAWSQSSRQPWLERSLVEGSWALVRGKQFKAALDLADAAIVVAPTSAQLHAVRASAWLGLGDASAAEAAGRYALALDPELIRAYRLTGRALAAQGRIDDAIDIVRSGLAHGPEHAGLQAQLGGLLLDQGDIEGAQAAADKLERLGTAAPAAKRLRAAIRAKRKSGDGPAA